MCTSERLTFSSTASSDGIKHNSRVAHLILDYGVINAVVAKKGNVISLNCVGWVRQQFEVTNNQPFILRLSERELQSQLGWTCFWIVVYQIIWYLHLSHYRLHPVLCGRCFPIRSALQPRSLLPVQRVSRGHVLVAETAPIKHSANNSCCCYELILILWRASLKFACFFFFFLQGIV